MVNLFFAEKSGFSEKGLFLEKKRAYFWKKAKGLTLLFAEKLGFPKRAYFWKKQRG